MSSTEFWALLALATAMSFTPGPNTTLSAALAANGGLRHALPFVCSVPAGWGVLLTLCSLGLGALVVALPWLNWGIKGLGVAYLWWRAWRLARSSPQASGSGSALQVGFIQGMALQFLNIKAWMLALAIVSGWIAGQDRPELRFAQVLPVMLAFAFASNLTYALVGTLLRQWLAGPEGSGRRLQGFNRVMAAVLVLTGAWMLQR